MPVKYGYDTVLDNAANNEQVGPLFTTPTVSAYLLDQQVFNYPAQLKHFHLSMAKPHTTYSPLLSCTVRGTRVHLQCERTGSKRHNSSCLLMQVYASTSDRVVQSSMDGINGTIFAYGVTSSGKTHTMMVSMHCCVMCHDFQSFEHAACTVTAV